jgi:hypothetical protein
VNRRIEARQFRVISLDKSGRNPLSLGGEAEHDGAPTEAPSREARSERTGRQGRFSERIQRRATDAELVAQAGMPRIQDPPELRRIRVLECNHGLIDTRCFRDHVQEAPPLDFIIDAGECEPLQPGDSVPL